jgi:hypothetical protein
MFATLRDAYIHYIGEPKQKIRYETKEGIIEFYEMHYGNANVAFKREEINGDVVYTDAIMSFPDIKIYFVEIKKELRRTGIFSRFLIDLKFDFDEIWVLAVGTQEMVRCLEKHKFECYGGDYVWKIKHKK